MSSTGGARIGNEQGLTASFVDQVQSISSAMDARATKLGLPFKLQFAIGHNYGLADLTLNKVNTDKMLNATMYSKRCEKKLARGHKSGIFGSSFFSRVCWIPQSFFQGQRVFFLGSVFRGRVFFRSV